MMRGQLGRLPPLSEAAATVRSRGPTGRASIRAADDVLEADLQSDEILACFEEALGERQPEMGTDAAAGREANAESAEAAPRLEAAAEQQREHSLLAPTAGRGVEPVLPDPVPMLHTNSGGGRRSCEPDAGARQQIGSAAASILERRGEAARAKVLEKVRDAGRADGDPAAPEEEDGEYDPEERLPDSDEEAEEYGVQRVVRGRVRLHGKQPASSGLDVDEQRQTSLAERRFVRTVVKRGVGPCGGADFDACPDRANYPPDVTGDLLWEMDMQQYTDENFNQHGVQARTADYRERKVGLFGDFLERVGHGKYVEWVSNEEQGGYYELKLVMKVGVPVGKLQPWEAQTCDSPHVPCMAGGGGGGRCGAQGAHGAIMGHGARVPDQVVDRSPVYTQGRHA